MTRSIRLGSAAFVLVAACQSAATDAVCPTTDPPTYANFGATFMGKYCVRCHSASLSGADRLSAPDDVNLDSPSDVQKHAQRVEATTASGPSGTFDFMPPRLSTIEPKPSAEERKRLGEWLACGAK